MVKGKIIINNKPAAGFNISLRLDRSQITQPAEADEEGRFEIYLPHGQYFYKGFIVDGLIETNKEIVLIKKDVEFLPDHSKKILDRFKELEAEFGQEKASQLLVSELQIFDYENAYPLLISENPSEIPDIIYHDSLSIISPRGKVKGPVEEVQFIWEAIPGAKRYDIQICKIVKEGDTTRYTSIIHIPELDRNSFVLGDLDNYKAETSFAGAESSITYGELYGFKIYAYDDKGELLTYSSEHDYVKFKITE